MRALHGVVGGMCLLGAALTSFVSTSAAAHLDAVAHVGSVASPLAGLEEPAPAFEGRVRQVLQLSSYTYVELVTAEAAGTPEQTAWVVSLPTQIHVGDRVHATPFGTARDFESRALDREFETLHFSRLAVQP